MFLKDCLHLSVFHYRYLVVAHPIWYRFRRNIKTSVVVCVLVWMLPLVFYLPSYLTVDNRGTFILLSVYIFLPLPLFIFCLVGTLRALSAAINVPADEKRRIVGILVVVLLIYTLLFLPTVVSFLGETFINNDFHNTAVIFLCLSPLADLIMYMFIRKGVVDRLLASLCCCKINSSQISDTDNDIVSSGNQNV